MDELILEWIAGYCAGILTHEEGRKLREWVDMSPENREVFERYVRLVKMQRMTEGGESIEKEVSWKRLQNRMRFYRARRIISWAVAVAAVVFLGVGVGFWLRTDELKHSDTIVQIMPGSTRATLVLANGSEVDLTRNDLKEVVEGELAVKNDTLSGLQYVDNIAQTEKPVFHTVKVPVAGEYHFVLSDGTKVWVNSDSEVTFPVNFSGECREVYVKGEAYFEVQPDASHPFIVHVDDVAVRVLGTKFNVAAYQESGQVVTTLVQGAVNVELEDKISGLIPGYQAVVCRNTKSIVKKKVETSVYVSWIKGVFEYENMPLSEIVLQLSRWYDVNFIFSASEFKERRFTGVVRKYELLNHALEVIEKTTNVRFSINGKNIAVQEAGN